MLWNMEQGQQVAIERENGEYLYYEATSVDFFPNDKVPEYVLNMESDRRRSPLSYATASSTTMRAPARSAAWWYAKWLTEPGR